VLYKIQELEESCIVPLFFYAAYLESDCVPVEYKKRDQHHCALLSSKNF